MANSDVATLKIIFGGSKPLRLTLKTNDDSWSCEQLKKCVTDQYLERKNTQMWRRWGTPQFFFFFFLHLLMNLKNNYLLKRLLKWANKNVKNSNIYNVVFFLKKIKKNTW